MRRIALGAAIAALSLGATACKHDSNQASGSGSAGGSGAAQGTASAAPPAAGSGSATAAARSLEVDVPAGFSGLGMETLLARLQGSWLVRGAAPGRAYAWNVRGRKVSVYDGARQKEYELSVLSPCAIKLARKIGGGSTSTISVVVFDGDTLYAGLGGAALSRGGAWAACLGGVTLTLRAGKCVQWKRSMFRDELKITPSKCGVADKKGGGKVFRASVRGRVRELEIHGNVAMTAQKRRAPAEKTDSFKTAKMKASGSAR